jgi:transcriptional regulator with XRE-family HTH domain
MPDWRHDPDPGTLAIVRDVGSIVRSARLGRGWTQQQLASQAGVTQPTISRIENGEVVISLPSFYRIAEVFGQLTIPSVAQRGQRHPRTWR